MQTVFHPLKAALELAVRFPQSGLRIDREIARDVHQNKEEIADFLFKSCLKFFGDDGSARTSDAAALRARPRLRKFLELLAKFIGFFMRRAN